MDNRLTQSAKQTLIFFKEFVRRKEVEDFIKDYRSYLNLPPEGLTFTKEDEKELSESILPHFYIPIRAVKRFPKEAKTNTFRIINTCMAITGQQSVKSYNVMFMLLHYLFFNRVTDIPLKTFDTADDLLMLGHLPSELGEYDNEDPFLLKCAYEHFEYISDRYPVALYINPEVSQNQIQDFLSKNWGFIQKYKEKTKNNFSAFKKKSDKKQEIKDFIYKNQSLPRKEIMKLVHIKFGEVYDPGYIGKMVSLEKKRRENK